MRRRAPRIPARRRWMRRVAPPATAGAGATASSGRRRPTPGNNPRSNKESLAGVGPARLSDSVLAAPRAAQVEAGLGALAPDNRDGILEPKLGDREVLGEVRPVDRADLADDVGRPEDVHEHLDRVGQLGLRGDEGVVAEVRRVDVVSLAGP